MPSAASRAPRLELPVFVCTFALFALMAAPGITWMDSGELAAAAHALGGAHPPGHPGHTLLGKLAALVPAGEIAFRIALLSAAAMAAALAALVALCRALLGGQVVAALVAAGLAALSPVVQVNATRVEVYAPAVALLLWAAVAVVRFVTTREPAQRDGRLVLAAALATGLAAAFHPLIALSAAVPMAMAVLLRARGRLVRLVPMAIGLGLLGLATYLYLPARAGAASPPLLMWGNPATPGALLDVMSAPAYQQNFALGGVPGRFLERWFLCSQGTGAGLVWAGLIGLGFAALTGLRGAGLVLAMAMCVVAGAATQEHMNPDMPGYVTLALLLMGAGLAPLCGAIVRVLTQSLPASVVAGWQGARHGLAAVVLVPVIGFALAAPTVHAMDSGFRRHDDALMWWSSTVARMPPGPGVYMSGHDHSLFAAQYERLVAGGRPDIAVAHLDLSRDRWFLAYLKRALPALHVPFIDDGMRGRLAERLARVNLDAGRPVGSDEPGAAGLAPMAAWPMDRAYLHGRRHAASLPGAAPPPRYHGHVGSQVSGLIGAVRAAYEMDHNRLDQAAVAAGLEQRFGGQGLDAMARVPADPGRVLLYRYLPLMSRVFIHEPWQSELLGDELAWQAGLDAGEGIAGKGMAGNGSTVFMVPERRLHALWRRLLTAMDAGAQRRDAGPAGILADIARLGPSAELATVRMLVAHTRLDQAESLVRAIMERRGEDAGLRMLLGSILGQKNQFAGAEVEFERAFDLAGELAPPPLRAEILARLGLARHRQGKTEAARRAWQQALALDPERTDIALQLGQPAAE